MSLPQQIDQDMIAAMKEGVAARTAVLRLLKASFKNEQIKLGHELSDDEALKVVQREAKQRKDSITQYQAANRTDLADAEKYELEVIESYLPEQMSEEEIGKIVDSIITETGASGMSEMGVVIGAVMKQVAGRADGTTVSRLVKERLS